MGDMAADAQKTNAALSQLLGHVFEALLRDVARSRSLLHEAIPSLIISFNGFRADLESQSRELQEVARELQGTAGSKGFLEQMRSVLDSFVSDLVTVSHCSMKLVQRVDGLGTDVDEIVNRVSHIESMAKSTRLIALNARIEAHRAGEAGKTFRVVADEVKALADDAAEFSQQIRDVVTRAHESLAEAKVAVSSLASHDLTSVLEAQRGVMATVEKLEASNGHVAQSLVRFHANVDLAIKALQFEDILNQLLGSVGDRLGSLRDLWTHWLAAQTAATPGAWSDLERLLGELRPGLEKPSAVQQGSMAVGTAELF
jgi:methyl-accepting chemotaxis protein